MALHLSSPLRSLSVESLKRQYQRSRRQVSELENQRHRLASGFAPREWKIGDTGPYWSRRDSRDYAADQLDARQVAQALSRMNLAVSRIDALLRAKGIDPAAL